MSPTAIIEAVAKYIGFNLDRTTFTFTMDEKGNMFSDVYALDKTLRHIPDIYAYDPTGKIALIYLKHMFVAVLKEQSATMFDILEPPASMKPYLDAWQLLCSPDVSHIEHELIDMLSKAITQVSPTPLLGDNADSADTLERIVARMVDGMRKCTMHTWVSDNTPIMRPEKMPSHIIMFQSITDALTTLNSAENGAYIAYIGQKNPADSFFAIFIKSNNTIVSYDDLILEAYPHQHDRFRNARYLEQKAFELFPYPRIGSFSKTDTNDDTLPFSQLNEHETAALLLATSCIIESTENQMPDAASQLYVTSLTPQSRIAAHSSEHAIDVAPNTAIIKEIAQTPLPTITTDEAISAETWEPAYIYDNLESKQKALAIIDDSFAIDSSHLLGNIDYKWIATKDMLQSVAMLNARKQVAQAYMSTLHREFEDWGGIEHLQEWYHEQLITHRDAIAQLCARDYMQKIATDKLPSKRELPSLLDCGISTKGTPGIRNLELGKPSEIIHTTKSAITLNETTYDASGRWHLLNPKGKHCSVTYIFKPYDFSDVEALIGPQDVPQVLHLWSHHASHGMFGYAGNDILDICDPVGCLQNPLSGYTWDSYPNQKRDTTQCFDFMFQIGFTKPELKAIAKTLPDT